MKRFKKLTIYILVGVLLSSSVMLSYQKADEVKAAAGTLTLSAAALVAIGLLGAYGIVYKGAVDSLTGDYVWESGQAGQDYGSYAERQAKVIAMLYAAALNQHIQNMGNNYDPNDDWDGDENKPPTWEKLVKYLQENTTKALTLAGTVLGSILSVVGFNYLANTTNYENGYGESTINTKDYGMNIDVTIVRGLQDFGIKLYWPSWLERYSGRVACTYMLDNKAWLCVGIYGNITFNILRNTICELNNINEPISLSLGDFNFSTNKYDNQPSKNGGQPNLYDGMVLYIPWNMDVYFFDGVTSVKAEEDMDRIKFSDLGMGSEFQVNPNFPIVDLVKPTVYLPSNNSVGDFVGGLSTNSGNSQQSQNEVDSFINSLQQPQYQPSPEPEPGPEPSPEPDPNPDVGGGVSPNPNPDPNPDVGGNPDSGEGGEDIEDNKDNSSLLADLKNVFPFCIPFDLINCFRLFNAEPLTPRVEVPLHFGIIDTDYTFVIDLEDFNGVAQVCRSMFLIMFIVGLVFSTRMLIRG